MQTESVRKYTSIEELPLTLNVEDVMGVLCIGRNVAYQLLNSGQLFTVRIGCQIRVSKKSILEFMGYSADTPVANQSIEVQTIC